MSEFGQGIVFGLFLAILCAAFIHWTEKARREYVKNILNENAALKRATQAAIDYFEDGITNKEQYAAHERFVEAIQPSLAQEQDDEVPN